MIWNSYHAALAPLEKAGHLRRPVVPGACSHNAHIYYVILEDVSTRTALIDELARRDISAVFHYVPLHSSPAGSRYGRVVGDLEVTESVCDRLLRLPLWVGMSDAEVERVIHGLHAFFGHEVQRSFSVL